MAEHEGFPFSTRRRFLQYLAMLGVGGHALLRGVGARAWASVAKADLPPAQWPPIPRRKLGRTGFEASRLVFGCGAALSRGRKDALLEAAFDAGINVFDVGSSTFYGDAERNLAPFLKKHRGEIFLISKAMIGIDLRPADAVGASQAKAAAATWASRLDQSLRELEVERLDAYYVMAANHPTIVGSDELRAAFQAAKQAGKVSHLGLSTHQNAQAVLEAAMQTGAYSVAMIAITPAGWYDWESKGILKDSSALRDLGPFLAKVRASGIGLVGMKAGRYLAGRRYIGWSNPDAFDEHYDERFLASSLSAFQRSYAYVLGHGLDLVNADMQSMDHLRENVIAASSSAKYFA